MMGDFSRFDFSPLDNFTGVLEQQGRVRLDQDGNAATEIGRHLRSLLGRDVIGPHRVAVPAEVHDSLAIVAASSDGSSVTVAINPGRAWLDGTALHVAGDQPKSYDATYLEPPLQSPMATPASIAAGVRDAVILEIWEEAFNGFQDPPKLIEPALGGPDTSERVRVAHRLRLRRLAANEDCETIKPSLVDDIAAKGRLSVTPAPTIVITGDCPVEAGGGYTGLEHHYYVVCIVGPDGAGNARFAWSRYGGGLVGRGSFDPVAAEITVTANQPMIDNAGLGSFFLEALAPHPDGGHWRVAMSADASLVENGRLALTNISGTWPVPAGQTAFFRLWDDAARISDFTAGPTELQDGIRLEFDAPAPNNVNYRVGDYWCFPVRASGVGFDPSVWPNDAPPKGPVYHRAPLGVLHWSAAPPTQVAPDDIEDCRDVFPPLTEGCHCCSFTVGDGHTSHGDFDAIEDAVRHLPANGGEVCLLPGLHLTNTRIEGRRNIVIRGCGKQTRVIPRPGARTAPIFHIVDSECIALVDMDLISLSGVVIVMEGLEPGALKEIRVERTRMLACRQAIHCQSGIEVLIRKNRIRMLDKLDAGVAIFLQGEDCRIERNDIGVVPVEATPEPPPPEDGEEPPDDPNDPCADADRIYAAVAFLFAYVDFIWGFVITAIVPPPYRALGGIQIAAGSERVKILDNEITGGAGNGITLGGSASDATETLGDFGAARTAVAFDNDDDMIIGTALFEDGQVAPGVTLRLRGQGDSGAGLTDVTEKDGSFDFRGVTRGAYELSVASPGLAIVSFTEEQEIQTGALSIGVYRLVLRRVREQPDPALAFLYDIRIAENDITAMGLNGIGTPPDESLFPARDAGQPDRTGLASGRFSRTRAAAVNPALELLGHPVIDLAIDRNYILGCMQTPFNTAMRSAAQRRGFGGISLGLCETVAIRDNRIETCGRRHIDPICGIYILFCEQLEITGNLIRDNGPLAQTGTIPIEAGTRGGIVANAATFGLQDLLLARDSILAGGKPACRIHGNVVQQPVGRAVTLMAIGPVSICANHLTTEISGPDALSRFVGGLLMLNVGGGARLPSGNSLFNDNQVRLGTESDSFLALALASADDIGFDGNQIDALQEGLRVNDNMALMVNSFILGATLRASDSRFQERTLAGEQTIQLSLLSLSSRMNATTNNQGDHCIFAVNQAGSANLVNSGNRALDNRFCERSTQPVQGATTDFSYGYQVYRG
jgi:hypothetical protein